MESKHPPTFDCAICTRSFSSPGALDDHYRGSVAHPNCSKCGKGFKNSAEHQEHRKSAHIPIPCGPCGGIMIDQDAQEAHYKLSSNHPACLLCERAFKDKDMYAAHIASVHAGQKHGSGDGEQLATTEAQKTNTEIPRDIYRGPGELRQGAHLWHTSRDMTTVGQSPSFPSAPPLWATKDFGLKYAPNEQPFVSRVLPPAQIITPPLLPTKFGQSLVANSRSSTARQPETPRIPFKSLPPPGDAINKLWGTYENVQATSSFAPPRSSRRVEAGAQVRGPRFANISDNELTGYSKRVLSWRVPNGDRVSRQT